MKLNPTTHSKISWSCFLCSIVAATCNAASFPLIVDFEDSTTGTDAPSGWRHGPPSGSKSIGMPWSVTETEDQDKVYQFSGPGQFDGNGRAYSTIPVDDVPFGDGASWRFSVDFRLVDFLNDGPSDSFRFGLGVLGQNTLFASASAGGFGGNDFYLIDWGYALPEEIRQLDQIAMTYRFIEFGALGAVEIGFYSVHIPAGFFNTDDSFRMIVEGHYQGSELTLSSWVENLTQQTQIDSVSAVANNPLPGRHFGMRLQSGAGVTTTTAPSPNNLGELTIHFDQVRLTDPGYVDPEPEIIPFWNAFTPTANGWTEGWLGDLYPAAAQWAFHPAFGWLHTPSESEDSAWLNSHANPDLGWIWTSASAFPHFMSEELGWCYLLDNEDSTPMIYIQSSAEWIAPSSGLE